MVPFLAAVEQPVPSAEMQHMRPKTADRALFTSLTAEENLRFAARLLIEYAGFILSSTLLFFKEPARPADAPPPLPFRS